MLVIIKLSNTDMSASSIIGPGTLLAFCLVNIAMMTPASAVANEGSARISPISLDEASNRSAESIINEANAALERFNRFRLESDLFIGLDPNVDERVVNRAGLLVQRLSNEIREFSDVSQAIAGRPLSEHTPANRTLGRRLFLVAKRLELLMAEQESCGLHDLGLLLSVVETLALELGQASLDEAAPGPQIDYLFFDGHLPNVVPKRGGNLNIVGRKLLRSGVPNVILTDPYTGEIFGPLKASRTNEPDRVVVVVEPALVDKNSGRCLYLDITHKDTSPVNWEKGELLPTERSLPVCVPLTFKTEYRIAGFLEYRTPTQVQMLPSKSLLFENDSCNEAKQVSGFLEWELHQGGRIIDTGESALYEAGDTAIDCEMSANQINCEGRLGPAVCTPALRAAEDGEQTSLLLAQSEWEHIFTPEEEYPEEETHRSWALSEQVELEQPLTQIELKIPREESSEKTTMWYELMVVNGGQLNTVFISPKTTVIDSDNSNYVVGQQQITTKFNAGRGTDGSTIGVALQAATCHY